MKKLTYAYIRHKAYPSSIEWCIVSLETKLNYFVVESNFVICEKRRAHIIKMFVVEPWDGSWHEVITGTGSSYVVVHFFGEEGGYRKFLWKLEYVCSRTAMMHVWTIKTTHTHTRLHRRCRIRGERIRPGECVRARRLELLLLIQSYMQCSREGARVSLNRLPA